YLLLSYFSAAALVLHSFPTRRSSDLIAAAFISRFMLFEGTFQHYHGLDADRARKYLEFAVEAAEFAMSGPYSFDSDFKSLFASEDRKSTRLNSSHVKISYAVFCLKKK